MLRFILDEQRASWLVLGGNQGKTKGAQTSEAGNCLPALLQFNQHLPRDLFQRLENAVPLEGDGFHHRLIFPAQLFGQSVHRQDIGQVAFVQLQNVGNLLEVIAMFFKVVHQVVERLDVGVHTLLLRIGDKDNAVYSAQDQLAAGVVKHLAGNGVEVNSGLETAHRSEISRQEVEEQ